ncbi:MAG: hypothetical protein GY940_38920 [bacterium]|nr:hypothetical protein [bacterium]
MKTKTPDKKLILNKNTVTDLNEIELQTAKGGSSKFGPPCHSLPWTQCFTM